MPVLWIKVGLMASITTTQFSHHETAKDLSLLFSSNARTAVLLAVLPDPMPSYYQRQLESATGMPLRAVQREVERLCGAGLLFRRAEGNRVYYQVNRDHPLFPELRGMVMKGAPPALRLRGGAAMDPAVRLCLLSPERDRALVVCHPGARPVFDAPGIALEVTGSEKFLRGLSEGHAGVLAWLGGGTDVLGRRDDVIWRHIEAAGHAVKKEPGVP